MAKIFLTGAAGFIGKHVWRHLLARGHTVMAVMRPGASKIEEASESGIVRADFTRIDAVDVFFGCDTVIHLAARAHVLKDSASNPEDLFRQINVEGTMSLLRLAAQAGVRRFVFVSSIGVNGNRTYGMPFTEDAVELPVDLYAISKYEAEKALATFSLAHGIEFVIVRPTLVYGPDAPGNFLSLLKLVATGLPLPFGSFIAKRSLLAVWNLADILERCVLHPAAVNQTFIAADEQQLTLSQILTNIGSGMQKMPKLLSISPQLLHSVALLIGKGPVVDKLAAELIVDMSKVRERLDWKPVYTTAEGLQRAGREYMEMKREKTI